MWGKTTRGQRETAYQPQQELVFHPLLLHMIDTAEVARAIWRRALGASLRGRWARAWGVDVDSAEAAVACLAGSHDLGKASPPFQVKWASGATALQNAGLRFPRPIGTAPHGIVTASELPQILSAMGISRNVADHLSRAVGGHHGALPAYHDTELVSEVVSEVGDDDWKSMRKELFGRLAIVEDADPVLATLATLGDVPAWTLMCLAGLASVADWIASDLDSFPTEGRLDGALQGTLPSYRLHAEQRAQAAMDRLLWTSPPARNGRPAFQQLFAFSPNSLQQQIGELAVDLGTPSLVIIEAPTGQGKSEAALYAAHLLTKQQGRHGLYFALPTEATSNQMFRRVVRYLSKAYPGYPVNTQLLHGHAALSAELEALLGRSGSLLNPQGVGDEGATNEDATPNVLASEWFLPRKRGLLAPFGIGTVDQVLLGVLRIRHFFVRLFGLAGKTVIIDEVHAYDAYMITLLNSLLEWLAHMGSSVIVLSATLPAKRREELVQAFARGAGISEAAEHDHVSASYPRITWVTEGRPPRSASIPVDDTASRLIRLRWVSESDDPQGLERLGQSLDSRLLGGGCAAVICNTVAEAQRVFRALTPIFTSQDAGDGAPELELFHAQFPLCQRQEIERRVVSRFGKVGSEGVRRPWRAVLVATQVIEQSLDLDFDVMVTQMAPADLVVQRAGRLWRHPTTPRPAGPNDAELWIWQGHPDQDGAPSFPKGDLRVYDEYVLLCSWLALRNRDRLRIPDDVEGLVESVYSESDCPNGLTSEFSLRFRRAREVMLRHRDLYEVEAERRVVRVPAGAWELFMGERQLSEPEDDHVEVNAALQALTRIGVPSITAIILQGTENGPWFIPGEHRELDRNHRPDVDVVKRLLAWSVRISHHGVVRAMSGREGLPPSWRQSPLLRGCRVLLIDEGGLGRAGDWIVHIDPRLGLVIEDATS
ncbi:CRISPR-associated protein Cas3 [Limnochorda pilosa]|uniref:CRISPR-associated protein Cas3 n=1 Tax=Limnochorda pilosa TaxID=1555112 RepID=A0A0K2SJL8_LIMPI|nr:CRISPR-associated protein Cas3 [Limnochorda pilosa]